MSIPSLNRLIGAWFTQDYDYIGETLEEIVGDFNEFNYPRDIAAAREDIFRFIQDYGDTDAQLDKAFVDVFSPGVLPQGFGALTTRQWLLKIASLLA